jgi:poly(glycerol-phosphate) alpha-glucosyltransferase
MRNAILTGSVSRNAGGLFESVRRLGQHLAQAGVEVRVFGTEDEFTSTDIHAWQPISVRALRTTWPRQFGYSPEFYRALVEFSPEITHTHGNWLYASVVTNRYSRAWKCPYVISPHGMLDPWALRNSRWKKLIADVLYEGAHLRGASCIRALCESEARAIRQLGLKNPIAIIPNGIDLPRLGSEKPETANRGENAEGRCQRAEDIVHKEEPNDRNSKFQGQKAIAEGQHRGFGFKLGSEQSSLAQLKADGRKLLLYLGRIHPKKGLSNLIRAWGTAQNSPLGIPGSEWILAIAGWDQGGHEVALKQLANELGIAWADVREPLSEFGEYRLSPTSRRQTRNAVSRTANSHLVNTDNVSLLFLGPQFDENKADCYSACDAFILPSLSEGVPMVVLEAWAHSKPVLMTPECNLDVGYKKEAAVRITADVACIASGLETLFSMSETDRNNLGRRGHAIVVEHFVWSRVADEMSALYRWILEGSPKPNSLADF